MNASWKPPWIQNALALEHTFAALTKFQERHLVITANYLAQPHSGHLEIRLLSSLALSSNLHHMKNRCIDKLLQDHFLASYLRREIWQIFHEDCKHSYPGNVVKWTQHEVLHTLALKRNVLSNLKLILVWAKRYTTYFTILISSHEEPMRIINHV